MAPLNNVFHNDPITLNSRRAMRVIGKLIETWSMDPTSRPASAKMEGNGRLIVFSAHDFKELLAALPEEDRLGPRDFSLRSGDKEITEVELVLRDPNRLTLLLPEPEAMAHHHQMAKDGEMPGIKLATLYRDLEPGSLDSALPLNQAGLTETAPATYQVHYSGENPLDAFLRPYLAAYCCTQCT
ncbi:MAG: hypothetical protein AB8B51_03470 [Sedimentitalea sp.]